MNYEFRIVTWLLFLLLAPGLWAQEVLPSPDLPILQSLNVSAPSDSLLAWTVRAEIQNPKSKIENRPAAGRDFWPLVAVQSAVAVWDIELTQRRLRRDPYWREQNPLALLPGRPSRTRMYAQFFTANAAVDYAAWRLRRAGHSHWARIVQIGSLAGYAWGIHRNATNCYRYAAPAPPAATAR